MSGFDDGPGAEMWELFEQESEDYLGQIESLLSGSAADLLNPETMSALFRAMHSLKGVSASLGLTGIELVAHHAEDLLDLFRNGEAKPDEATRDLLLQTADTLIALREACVSDQVDAPADMQLVSLLSAAKAQLKSGGAVAPVQQQPAAQPAPPPPPPPEPVAAPAPPPPPPPPAPEESGEDDAAPSGQISMQVSQEPADPSEQEFQPETVEPFAGVVKSELGQLAEALESPELESLDMQGISSSILAIREVANEVGYLGISSVLDGIAEQLRESDQLDKTELTRGLCIFVHRLRVLSELTGAGIAMEDVDDSMSPHISKEARDVVDRLSVAGGASRDWELVGVLARALGVQRISALARLASELTIQDGWQDRAGALDVLDEIRRESQVIGIEGLNVSSLDMRRKTYDRLRDQMALLLTNAEAAVAELRTSLGDEIFNSLSPTARQQIADFLKEPNANLLEIQAKLPDGPDYTMQVMARIDQERVMSNRVLVDIDPELYQFLIGVTGSPDPLMASLQGIGGASQAIQSWAVLASSKVQTAAAPQPQARPQPQPQPQQEPAADEPANVMHIGDDWTVGQTRAQSTSSPQPAQRPAAAAPPPPPPQAPAAPQAAPAATPAAPAAPQQSQLQPVASDSSVPAERTDAGAPARNVGGSSLRVSSELVDNYLDTVAELRLCISRIEQGASEAGFANTIAELRSLAKQTGARKAERLNVAASQIDEAGKVLANQIAKAETTLRMLHSVTLQLRVVPISIVLGRMPRLVRDLSRSLGKQVNLEVEDGDIQIDKSMVDALMEPMVHMIRNAMDHGIEPSDERVRLGKSEKATLRLQATQNGNVAQIMIADDGRGLNTGRIRAKAIERGLITDQDASRMSEREIQRLIFAPGFSTAAAVTETSGRGVGMDVVLTTIRRLGGAIDIDSVEGEGTKFYLSFPVSAALQRIVVVTDGERDLGLPERAIVEVIEVRRSAIQEVGELAGIQHRDGFLPVRSIETMLGWETPEVAANQSAMPVVIIGTPQRRVGVAVSRVKRRQEVFMKELHPALNAVDVLAGATVMGEGQPLLVLDPETLIAIAGG